MRIYCDNSDCSLEIGYVSRMAGYPDEDVYYHPNRVVIEGAKVYCSQACFDAANPAKCPWCGYDLGEAEQIGKEWVCKVCKATHDAELKLEVTAIVEATDAVGKEHPYGR